MTAGVWSDYFPFDAGEELKLEAKVLLFSVKGKAEVLARDDNELGLRLQIPGQAIVGQEIPEIDATLAFTYRGDGGGNRVVIDHKDRQREDDNLSIVSKPDAGERRIDPSIAIAGKTIGFTLVRAGDRKGEIRDVTGLDLPFAIKILLKPS